MRRKETKRKKVEERLRFEKMSITAKRQSWCEKNMLYDINKRHCEQRAR